MGVAMDQVSRWQLGMGFFSRSFILFGTLLLIFLPSCTDKEIPAEDDPRGELLFIMDCQWDPSASQPRMWQCEADVDNEFVAGHIVLALMDEERLAFCGEDLHTQTGNNLYDSLVENLTEGRFNCVFVRENVSGNEFDWIWDDDNNALLMIWRPINASNKFVTLAIDERSEEKIVNGWAYYYEEN